jgi:polar amino acid transport system substrate-binding protein
MLETSINDARRSALFGLTLLMSGTFSELTWADDKKLTMITEEWAPYNFSEDGVLKGSSVEVVQQLIEKLGLSIPIGMYPSMRTRVMLNNMSGTMMFTMLRTPEREGRYKWIGPLSNLEDAKKVKLISCRHAGLVLETLKANGFANLDSTSTEGEAVYRKLLLGRCDLAISDAPLGVRHLLRKLNLPPQALVQTSVRLIDAPLYIACSLDIPDQEIARWQRALDTLKSSGLFAEINRKYQ